MPKPRPITVATLPERLWRVFWAAEKPIRARHAELIQAAWLTGSWLALCEAEDARRVELDALAAEVAREHDEQRSFAFGGHHAA